MWGVELALLLTFLFMPMKSTNHKEANDATNDDATKDTTIR